MKMKKRYNYRARQVIETKILNTEKLQVDVNFKTDHIEKYDDCNALVLPSKKRKTKIKIQTQKPVSKMLSKKQRKQLEKIVERKKKKENRSKLLDALSKVQVPDDVLKQMTSITEVQTKGIKRILETTNENQLYGDNESGQYPVAKKRPVINSIKGAYKKGSCLLLNKNKKLDYDPNDKTIVGFENYSDYDSEEISDKENTSEEVDPTVVDSALNSCSNISTGNTKDTCHTSTETDKKVIDDSLKTCTSVDVKNANEKINSSTSETMCNNSSIEENSCLNKKTPCDIVTNFVDSIKNKWTVFKSTLDENCLNSFENEQCPFMKENGTKEDSLVKGTDEKYVEKESNENVTPTNKQESIARKQAVYVPVNRKPEIQTARLKLPILGEEQIVMEAINENSTVIIAGETGSGKTTQVPQFLYEAGYALNGRIIGVTEPRRVAAMSMSRRVGEELNLSVNEVSYLIRFQGNVTPDTKIKFMTDGVLFKEIQSDFLLRKYSVIILDEAHERSSYTDILIGFLSRIVPIREKRNMPLKLIIMSATLRISDFTENKRLFNKPPPVITVESRQFPVSIHFNRRTNPDYVGEAFRKACKIHMKLPDGGILIFVTGQQEINVLVNKLKRAFPFTKKNNDDNEEENEDEEMDQLLRNKKRLNKKKYRSLPKIDLDKYSLVPTDDAEGDIADDASLLSDDDTEEAIECGYVCPQPLWVLPMYSILPNCEQIKVFKPPPEGSRLCVVATNIAETSLTIPNIKYVVDSGKVKTKVYDKRTGVSAFTVMWTSKASANQRAGRAGRTGPGHCYRLYSSAVFNDELEPWCKPEIQRRPVEDLILQLKAVGIKNIVNFPFPSPPDIVQLNEAGKILTYLGALPPQPSNSKIEKWNGNLTKLGESMALFPVSARCSKMLCLSNQHGLMSYTVCIVAALSVQELLLLGNKQCIQIRRKVNGSGHHLYLGDIMVLLRAACVSEIASAKGNLNNICNKYGLRLKAVIEVRKLRLQLTKEINLHLPELNLFVDPSLPRPTELQAKMLRQIVLACFVDQVAKRVREEEAWEFGIKKGTVVYRTMEMEDFVYIHPNSALFKENPEWVVYQEVCEMSRLYMIGITAIEPEWLPMYAASLCNIKVLNDPPPTFNESTGSPYCHVSGTFGRGGWRLPISSVEYPDGLDRYKWFAVFILDGSVFPNLGNYTKKLLSSPSTMVKTWAKLLPRTASLLNALITKEISSKSEVLECWSKDKKYLLKEYLEWLPEPIHNEVILMWPPIEDVSITSLNEEKT